jgi:uncharacterized protein (UPF0335 family)
MALREIIILPDKQLRLVSRPIEKVTSEVRKLADDMFETMYDAPGIGLAAIQVAQPVRLITMDLAKKNEEGEITPQPRVFINPGNPVVVGRDLGLRGRLPVDPGILRGGRAASQSAAALHRPRRQGA